MRVFSLPYASCSSNSINTSRSDFNAGTSAQRSGADFISVMKILCNTRRMTLNRKMPFRRKYVNYGGTDSTDWLPGHIRLLCRLICSAANLRSENPFRVSCEPTQSPNSGEVRAVRIYMRIVCLNIEHAHHMQKSRVRPLLFHSAGERCNSILARSKNNRHKTSC